MDEFAKQAALEVRARRTVRKRWFLLHLTVWLGAVAVLVLLWAFGDVDLMSAAVVSALWGVLVAAHGVWAYLIPSRAEVMIDQSQESPPDDQAG